MEINYFQDEFSSLVQEWNNQRSMAVERALTMILYPELIKELRNKLVDEAKEHVLKVRTKCFSLSKYHNMQAFVVHCKLIEVVRNLKPKHSFATSSKSFIVVVGLLF